MNEKLSALWVRSGSLCVVDTGPLATAFREAHTERDGDWNLYIPAARVREQIERMITEADCLTIEAHEAKHNALVAVLNLLDGYREGE